ncbi:MAG: hypothetical protein ACP5G0_09605 [Desulfomonilia bacterium]
MKREYGCRWHPAGTDDTPETRKRVKRLNGCRWHPARADDTPEARKRVRQRQRYRWYRINAQISNRRNKPGGSIRQFHVPRPVGGLMHVPENRAP